MEVTDFDPRDVRIRRYNVPDPEPRGLGGNRQLRAMLLETMLALPLKEMERRAQEAAEQRRFQFARDERAADQRFSKEMAGTAHENALGIAKAGQDFTKSENELDRGLKREEMRNKPDPMADVIKEEALKNAIAQGDDATVHRMAPGADAGQLQAVMRGASDAATNNLADSETVAGLVSRVQGIADAEPGDQPSAAQNWRRAHEVSEGVMRQFGSADSATKKVILEQLKNAYMGKLRVKHPGAADEFETPRHERFAPLRFLARSEV